MLSPVQPALHPERKSSSSSSSSSGSRDGGSNSYRTTHERRVSQACDASSSHQETVDRHRCQASTERCRAQSGISSRRQSSDGRRRRHVCVCHHGQQNCESRRRNGREHHVRGEVSRIPAAYMYYTLTQYTVPYREVIGYLRHPSFYPAAGRTSAGVPPTTAPRTVVPI